MNIQDVFAKYTPSEQKASLQQRSYTVQKNLFLPIFSLIAAPQTTPGPLVRLSKNKEAQYIREYSALDKQIEYPILEQSDNLPALLGLIFADKIVQNSDYEKASSYECHLVWIKYLQTSKIAHIPDDLIARFKQLLTYNLKLQALLRPENETKNEDIANFAKEIVQTVHKLEVKKSYLIEGGCVNDKGISKALIFEFIKQDKETYDLHLFLAGNEALQLRNYISNGTKCWFNPIARYMSIPSEEFLFNRNSADFFQALIETKLVPQLDIRKVESLLLGDLIAYRQDIPTFDLQYYTSVSSSQSNAWANDKVLAIYSMDREKYKKLIAEIKMRSLIEGYQLSKQILLEDSSRGRKLRTLFKYAATNLSLLELAKVKSKQDQAFNFDIMSATVLDLKNRLETAETEISTKRKASKIPLLLDDYAQDKRIEKRKLFLSETSKLIKKSEKNDQPPTDVSVICRPFELPSAEIIPRVLLNYLKKSSHDKKTRALEIERVVDQLPIPNDENEYWSVLPNYQFKTMMECLKKLLYRYDLAIRENYRFVNPKQANTVLTLYALVHYFAVKLDNLRMQDKQAAAACLENYPIYYPGIEYDNDPYLMYTNPNDEQRRAAVLQYFRSTYEKYEDSKGDLDLSLCPYPLFDFALAETAEQNSLIGHYKWLSALAESHPQLRDGSISKIEKLNDLLTQLFERKNTETNLFVLADLEYIPILANAAFLAHQFSSHSEMLTTKPSIMYAETKKGALEILHVEYFYGDWKIEKNHFPSSKKMHPKISTKTVDWLKNYKWNSRLKHIDTRKEEGNALQNGDFLMRLSCEPNLYPYTLLEYYHRNIHKLASVDEQVIFEIELFRSVSLKTSDNEPTSDIMKKWEPYTREIRYPLQMEIKNPHFQEQCRQFIEKGIDRFYTRQTLMRPDVLPLLFFLRLSMRLNGFVETAVFLDPVPLLLELLKRKDLTIDELSYINLHLAGGYCQKKDQLKQSDKELLFSSWCYYKISPLSEKWFHPLMDSEVESKVNAIAEELTNQSVEFYKNILEVSLRQLDIEMPSQQYEINIISPTYFTVVFKNGDMWALDILKGQFYIKQEIIKRILKPAWMFEFTSFKPVSSSFIQSKDAIYFNDEIYGPCFAITVNDSKILQKNFGDELYQYVPQKNLSDEHIPSSLIDGHTHWLATQPSECSLIICDASTGKQVAYISVNGEIINGNLRLHQLEPDGCLSRFDEPKYILCSTEDGALKTIFFSRYISSNSEPLLFEIENGKVIYSSNRKYQLCKEQQKDLLRGSEEYLHLIHHDQKKQKLLVPLNEISKYNKLDVSHSLFPSKTQKESSLKYIEYDLVDEQVIPLTHSGVCFLSYLKLAGHDYEGAKKLLDQIDFREQLSSENLNTLAWIVKISSSGNDLSGEAAAIALHAWIIGKEFLSRKIIEKKYKRESIKDWNKKVQGAIERYFLCCHKIPNELLLTKKQVDLLPFKLQNSKLTVRLKASDQDQTDSINDFISDMFTTTAISSSSSISTSEEIDDLRKRLILENSSFLPTKSCEEPSESPIESILLNQINVESPTFFPNAYKTAKYGTKTQKDQLAFRLKFISMKYSESPPAAWKYLQNALDYPKKAPELPNYDNFEERWNFVKTLSNNVLECSQLKTKPKNELDTFVTEYQNDQPNRSLSPAEIHERVVHNAKSPVQFEISEKTKIGKGFTTFLSLTHLSTVNKDAETNLTDAFTFRDEWLSNEEKLFENALKAETAEIKSDYEQGRQKNNNQKLFTVNNIQTLQNELHGKIVELKEEMSDIESALLEIANKKASNNLQLKLEEEAGLKKELSIKNLVMLFLKGDKDLYYKANTHLRDQEFNQTIAKAYGLPQHQDVAIDYIHNLIGLYMNLSVYTARLQRAEKLCGEIDNIKDEENANRISKIQKLAYELHPLKQPNYSIKEYPALLVFEYLSGFTLRQEQITAIKELLKLDPTTNRYQNKVIQLIMGGGKTTVLAVILLLLAAKPGRLSLFVTPTSQYTSVSHDLSKTIREHFGMEMETIDVARNQLDFSMCNEILHRLQETSHKGDFLLAKAESLQCLELEFMDLIYRSTKTENIGGDTISHINSLRQILFLLRKQGDALLDEVDILLNVMQEVNFPIGPKVHIEPVRIELIKEMFVIMVSKNAQISDGNFIDLKEKIGIESNRQTFLSMTDLQGDIAKAIAKHLAENFAPLNLQKRPEFLDSFYRYISGKMDIICQTIQKNGASFEEIDNLTEDQKADLDFLDFISFARDSNDKGEQEGAHLAALAKHMLQSVLPTTFQKKGNQHYGCGAQTPGEKRPYWSVDTPSDNLFGYHWEAVAYHFQTALQFGISEVQLLEVAKTYKESAEEFSSRDNILINETTEAKEFKTLTNVELSEIELPGMVQKALQNLNANIRALLTVESASALQHIKFHNERLTSTGCALVRMFATIRAMSGTPWNSICYHPSLGDHFVPDIGTEGSIASKIISRAETRQQPTVHIVKEQSIEKILESLLAKHPQKNRVRMLMDSGALFKNFKNYEVAKAIRDYLNIPVLFFTQNISKGQKTPDTLALLKVGNDQPIFIEGTRPEQIEKTGLGVTDYFVFADERHTTGTDIPMVADAIGMMTIDETMLRRSFFQTVLRLREFFLKQEVEFVIPAHLLKNLINVEHKNELSSTVGSEAWNSRDLKSRPH